MNSVSHSTLFTTTARRAHNRSSVSAVLSDMTLEVTNLDNQISLQDVSLTEGCKDRAPVILAVCAVDNPEGGVGTVDGVCRRQERATESLQSLMKFEAAMALERGYFQVLSLRALLCRHLAATLYDSPVSSALSCQRRWAAAWSYDATEDSTARFFTKYAPVTPATSGEVAR